MISAGLICLALNVYAEARGEPVEGKSAVAHVTVNRAADPRYPEDLCEVVYDPDQFSWTRNPLIVREPEKLTQAVFIAASALFTDQPDPTNGATHFYSGQAPYWAKHMQVTAQIGGHTFLKDITP